MEAFFLGMALMFVAFQVHALTAGAIFAAIDALVKRGIAGRSFWRNFLALQAVALVLVALHVGMLAAWAGVFLWCGEFADFNTAFYHSAGNYTSLGYGDLVLRSRWRLLGPLEAATGILMFGVTAATFFAVLNTLASHRRGPAGKET